jgi:hypothetical protein
MNRDRSIHSTINRLRLGALIDGLVASAVAIAGSFISGPGQFFQSYLYSFVFWIGISLGCLAIMMLYYVAGGRWAYTMRGIVEAGSRTVWLMLVFFIPIVIGLAYIYTWARPADVAASPLLQAKSVYLNPTAFVLRGVIYFAIWIILSTILSRMSARPGADTDPAQFRRLRGWSAAGLILYVITMSFAAIDWMMSLQPEWTSSIFGLVIVLGQGLSSQAFAIIMLWSLTRHRRESGDSGETRQQTNRDTGAVLLALVMGWAYMSFFQFLIIWAGNLPREIVWYVGRLSNGWQVVALLVVVAQFALPLFALLSMRTRSSLGVLMVIAALIFAVNLLFVYWQVMPAFYPGGFHLHWLDLVIPVAMGGLWLFVFATRLRDQPAALHTELTLPYEPTSEVRA